MSNGPAYAFMIGVWTFNASATAGIASWVGNPDLFAPMFAMALATQIITLNANLTSNQYERLGSSIRRFGAALFPPKGEPASLEGVADRNPVAYSLREEHAGDRILTFRSAMLESSATFLYAVQTDNHDAIAGILANLVKIGFRLVRDVEARDPTVFDTFQTHYLPWIQEPERLWPLVWKRLKYEKDPKTLEYYHRTLSTWLGLPPAKETD